MSSEQLVPLNGEGVMVTPRIDGDTLRITMSGAVEMRDPGEVLNPYWMMIDEEARRRKVTSIDVDVRDLNFMNSSGILTLVRWITRAKAHTGGYRLVLRYDPNVTWQRSSIPTLAKLAPNIVVPQEIHG